MKSDMVLEDKIRFGFYGFIIALIFVGLIFLIPIEDGRDIEIKELHNKISIMDADINNLTEENIKLNQEVNQLVGHNQCILVENNRLQSVIDDMSSKLDETNKHIFNYAYVSTSAKDIVALCRTTLGEAGCSSDIQKAAVVWCILNRVDSSGKSIYDVTTDKDQFHGYNEKWVVREDELRIVLDVLYRWQREKLTGETDPGRVLPKEYLYFCSGKVDEDGKLANIFRDAYDFNKANYWDFNCWNPYK